MVIAALAALPMAGQVAVQTPVAVVVTAGSVVAQPMPIDAGEALELDLVAGRIALPAIEALRLSIWVAGGPVLAAIVREQPVQGTLVANDGGAARIRFHLPVLEARPGAVLRLAISVAGAKGVVAEAWLRVSEPFDPAGLREWAERHALAVDPALAGVVAALRKWGIPVREEADTAIAIVGNPESAPPGATAVLILRQAKDGRSRMVVRVISGETKRVELSLPSLTTIASDPDARHDFLAALREVATLLGTETTFPNP